MAKYRHFREVSAIVHHFRVTIEKQEEKLEFISISILLFSSIGMISAARMHLYRTLLFHRDYFDRPDASLSDSFAPQGLLYPGQMHLYLALLCRRDYFARLDASLSGSFVPQGLFRPPGCIPSLEGHR